MTIESLEVYSSDSNFAVIRPPGRQFPGAVIQGDTLAELCRTALSVVGAIHAGETTSAECRDDVAELTNALIHRILHYQRVLDSHGTRLPFANRFTESHLVTAPDHIE